MQALEQAKSGLVLVTSDLSNLALQTKLSEKLEQGDFSCELLYLSEGIEPSLDFWFQSLSSAGAYVARLSPEDSTLAMDFAIFDWKQLYIGKDFWAESPSSRAILHVSQSEQNLDEHMRIYRSLRAKARQGLDFDPNLFASAFKLNQGESLSLYWFAQGSSHLNLSWSRGSLALSEDQGSKQISLYQPEVFKLEGIDAQGRNFIRTCKVGFQAQPHLRLSFDLCATTGTKEYEIHQCEVRPNCFLLPLGHQLLVQWETEHGSKLSIRELNGIGQTVAVSNPERLAKSNHIIGPNWPSNSIDDLKLRRSSPHSLYRVELIGPTGLRSVQDFEVYATPMPSVEALVLPFPKQIDSQVFLQWQKGEIPTDFKLNRLVQDFKIPRLIDLNYEAEGGQATQVQDWLERYQVPPLPQLSLNPQLWPQMQDLQPNSIVEALNEQVQANPKNLEEKIGDFKSWLEQHLTKTSQDIPKYTHNFNDFMANTLRKRKNEVYPQNNLED